MKKEIFLFLLVIFLIFFGVETTYAFSPNAYGFSKVLSSGIFGGRIIDTKAVEIEAYEAMGFICSVPGTSISIIPIGSLAGIPTSYIIPLGISSATNFPPASGQLILGRYVGKATAPCVYPSVPPLIQIVILDAIMYFGNSQR